jgi:hypothetical protein
MMAFQGKKGLITVGVQPLGCSSYWLAVQSSGGLECPAEAETTNEDHQCQPKGCTPTK